MRRGGGPYYVIPSSEFRNFVTGLDWTHSRSDPDHDPGDVMAQNERQAIPQNELELAVADFGIQKVDPSGRRYRNNRG
jgi:hypothetical protein